MIFREPTGERFIVMADGQKVRVVEPTIQYAQTPVSAVLPGIDSNAIVPIQDAYAEALTACAYWHQRVTELSTENATLKAQLGGSKG